MILQQSIYRIGSVQRFCTILQRLPVCSGLRDIFIRGKKQNLFKITAAVQLIIEMSQILIKASVHLRQFFVFHSIIRLSVVSVLKSLLLQAVLYM